LFGPEVQAEAAGADGHFLAPTRAVPSVRATPHADGWELNGVWDFSSGAPYSTHALSAVMLPPGEDGAPRFGMALVPRSQYTVLDDWGDTLGMRGSGSHSIRVENAVVPREYVVERESTIELRMDACIGVAVHGNPMYTGRLSGVLQAEILAIEIGLVRSALDEYTGALHEKKPMWNPQVTRAEDPQYQEWYGNTSTLLDSAEALVNHVGNEYHRLCERQAAGMGTFSRTDDRRLRRMAQLGCRLTTEAMDLLTRTGGSSTMRAGSRMERYWRDFSMLRTHAAELTREMSARQLGAELLKADGTTKEAGQ
jgi:3-hydroxy-9,10-secoandrosta-1,3,5(10)-triene-9,17-dione monooxygenase